MVLSIIGKRARYTSGSRADGLELFEAFVGDLSEYHLGRGSVTGALRHLRKRGLITTRLSSVRSSANGYKVTVAKLVSVSVFDLGNEENLAAVMQCPKQCQEIELCSAEAVPKQSLCINKKERREEGEERIKKENPPSAFSPQKNNQLSIPENLQTGEFKTAWSDWQKHRREIRKPITPTSGKAQLIKLSKLGEEKAVLTIEHTITNGWQGLREPETAQQRSNGKPAKPKVNSYVVQKDIERLELELENFRERNRSKPEKVNVDKIAALKAQIASERSLIQRGGTYA
jgi:hypothetical protein